MVLRSGATEDQVDVVNKVTDDKPWRGFITLDNTGAGGGVETVTSGSITLNVTGAGDVGLSAANALTIGSATGNGAGSTATSGTNTFTSADRIDNGTAGTALDVSFGAASGGATNNTGSLIATTDGGAGAAGEIQITSGEALRLGAIATGAGAQNVSIGTTGTAVITVPTATKF